MLEDNIENILTLLDEEDVKEEINDLNQTYIEKFVICEIPILF